MVVDEGGGYRAAMTAPRPLSYWTSTISRLVEEQVEDAVTATGLDRPQWRVLDRLAAGAVAREQATDLLAPYAGGEATTDVLRSLVSAGLAEEQAHEFRLTEAGRERVTELREGPVRAVNDRATAELDPAELDAVLTGLEQVARGLGWAQPRSTL